MSWSGDRAGGRCGSTRCLLPSSPAACSTKPAAAVIEQSRADGGDKAAKEKQQQQPVTISPPQLPPSECELMELMAFAGEGPAAEVVPQAEDLADFGAIEPASRMMLLGGGRLGLLGSILGSSVCSVPCFVRSCIYAPSISHIAAHSYQRWPNLESHFPVCLAVP